MSKEIRYFRVIVMNIATGKKILTWQTSINNDINY